MIDIASSTVPLLERARGLVESLDRWLPLEAIWLTLSDPQSHDYATIGSTGLERPVLDYLHRPTVAREIQLAQLNHDHPPVAVTELPVPFGDLPTWAECLIPAGFRDGLAVPLVDPGGPHIGMLSLLYSSTDPQSDVLRYSVGQLAPLIARAVSPLRSLLATARLVQGATAGAVLLRDGNTYPLPGLETHRSFVDSLLLDIAWQTLLAGEVYRSFMWPAQDGPGPATHARITVLAANDAPAFVLGTVLLAPDAECRGLTPRELEVLGLIVDGRSNQQIATRLTVAPPHGGSSRGAHPAQARGLDEDSGGCPGGARGLLRPRSTSTPTRRRALSAAPASSERRPQPEWLVDRSRSSVRRTCRAVPIAAT